MDKLTVGIDEAGRGPLAGPVVAAAVILDPEHVPEGLDDSKKLSAARRERLAIEIRDRAVAWGIGQCEVEEIDRMNILQATLLAMRRAFDALGVAPTRALVDGNRLPELPCPAEAIVQGDGRIPSISAASILAKVHRDALMRALHEQWPAYGFDRHNGYGTAGHLAALEAHGPCPAHRRSFAPVRRVLDQLTLDL
ncbi:MAG: ribonuclease HII [Gammaproteobacteria bacterium]|nr:MAG: ribonuclease HII [Gammaproteobacteria bacterium]